MSPAKSPAFPSPARPGPALAARLAGALLALLPLPLVTSTSLGAGCTSATQAEAETYVAAMQPLLAENMKLTREFVDVATEVKKGTADPRAIATRFEVTLVPGATALRDQVLAVQPADADLAALHRGLGEAWTGRVDAWAELHRAWGGADLEAFDKAMRRNLEVKAAEERYFTGANTWLSTHGEVTLDQFP